VLNTANITDTFTLTADSAWTVTAPAAFGPLGPNRSASLKVAVTVPADVADGTLDAAQITLTSQGDGLTTASAMLNTTANNPAPPEADLSVSQTAPTTAQVGGQIVYTIVVNNAGPGEALNVELVDTLPAGVTFVSASEASCTHAAGVVTCALGSLAVNGEATLTSPCRWMLQAHEQQCVGSGERLRRRPIIQTRLIRCNRAARANSAVYQ
jgi:uncharacterized repeat protein (TIGR01451 family)